MTSFHAGQLRGACGLRLPQWAAGLGWILAIAAMLLLGLPGTAGGTQATPQAFGGPGQNGRAPGARGGGGGGGFRSGPGGADYDPWKAVLPQPLTPRDKFVGKGSPQLDADMLTFLVATEVFADPAEDPIWQIHPTFGHRMVQIPLQLRPDKAPYLLDTQTFHVKGGTVIGYRFSPDVEMGPDGRLTAQKAQQQLIDAPEGPPQVARTVWVYPDGQMRWKLEHNFTNSQVKDVGRLYAFKLRHDLLEKRQAGQMPTLQQGNNESQAEFVQRRNQATAEHKQLGDDYKELQRVVKAAPEEFEQPITPVVWLMVAVAPGALDLDIDGPAPFPWKISFATLQQFRENTKPFKWEEGRNHTPELGRPMAMMVEKMTRMAADKWPLSPRIVAYVMSMSELTENVANDPSLRALAEAVLKSDDATARDIVTKDLVFHTVPSLAQTSLLAVAAPRMAPGIKIEDSKRKWDNNQINEAIEQTNKDLSDPNGPAPRDILNMLIRDQAPKHPELVSVMASQVRFSAVPDKRLDQVVAVVIESAPSSALARGWLDQQLLGAVEPRTVLRTLEALDAAGTTANPFGEVVEFGLNTVIGAPPGSAASERPVANLKGPIPVDSTSNSLFKGLLAQDLQIRGLAWRALSRFTFVPPPAPAGGAAGLIDKGLALVGEQTDCYKALTDAALSQQNTPAQVVDFLVRQSDAPRVADSLVLLVVKASDQVSAQATRALLRSRSTLPIGKGILNLSYGDRVAFAQRVYENTTGQHYPTLCALLKQRADNSPLPPWFGQSIGEGVVPPPSQWSAALGGDDKTLELVLAADTDVAAGAVSALVWGAGGDDGVVPRLSTRFRNSPDQSATALKKMWAEARREVYLARLQRSAGSYRLLLRVGNPTPTGKGSPAAADLLPTGDITLGVVKMEVDAGGVHLSNQSTLNLGLADTQLAIRVQKPAEFKNFPGDRVGKLPLDRVTAPVDLLPLPNGSWQGRFALPNGQPVDVIMQPAGGA